MLELGWYDGKQVVFDGVFVEFEDCFVFVYQYVGLVLQGQFEEFLVVVIGINWQVEGVDLGQWQILQQVVEFSVDCGFGFGGDWQMWIIQYGQLFVVVVFVGVSFYGFLFQCGLQCCLVWIVEDEQVEVDIGVQYYLLMFGGDVSGCVGGKGWCRGERGCCLDVY